MMSAWGCRWCGQGDHRYQLGRKAGVRQLGLSEMRHPSRLGYKLVVALTRENVKPMQELHMACLHG